MGYALSRDLTKEVKVLAVAGRAEEAGGPSRVDTCRHTPPALSAVAHAAAKRTKGPQLQFVASSFVDPSLPIACAEAARPVFLRPSPFLLARRTSGRPGVVAAPSAAVDGLDGPSVAAPLAADVVDVVDVAR